MKENLETLTDAELEQLLFDASALPGRAALARVTALRTILRRRAQANRRDTEEDAQRALERVNATRGPDSQLAVEDLHPTDVASVLADPEWAGMVGSDEELRRSATAFAERRRRMAARKGADA